MKSNFSRFLHHTLSHSDVREVFTSSLSLSDLIGESRLNQVANLSHLDYRVKPDNDSLCAGRSMVEMLGVLAIIGVLSVGAIAGYSKAMMKYKLNKHTEQMNTILSAVQQYRHEWKSMLYTPLKPYYQKMGLLPPEMIKDNSDKIYDIFNNSIRLTTNGKVNNQSYALTIGFGYHLNSNNYDVCLNFFTVLKSYHEELYRTVITKNENGTEIMDTSFYGDKFCNSRTKKCIRNISMEDIYTKCNYCKKGDDCGIWTSFPTEDYFL